jgi:Skp family chaperone for outer membrane proteins
MKETMKTLFPRMLAAGLFVALSVVSTAAVAEQLILVVDSDRLWRETAAGKDVQRQLKEFQAKIEKDLKSANDSLKSEVTDLNAQKQRSIISDEVYQQKIQELAGKRQQLMEGVQKAQVLAQVANRNAQSQFYQAIRPSLVAIVEKRKGDLLIERSQTLYATADHEITADAVRMINTKFKALPVVLLPKQTDASKKADAKKRTTKKKKK